MHKVLIVDDQADIRQMMNIALREDFKLLEAADGKTALELVRNERPDLVLLDVMMPGGMDGLQVLAAIRTDPEIRDTCVIMVSAKGQVHDYELGIKSGANAYFVKPFSPMQLLAAINQHIAESKHHISN